MASKKQNWAILGGVGLLAVLVYEYLQNSPGSDASTPATSAVQNGDVLNYNAEIQVGFFSSVADALTAISGTLLNQDVTVVSSKNNNSLLQVFESAVTVSGQTVGITLQVQEAGDGYGSALDLKSVIDNAVYQATGYMPVSSSIAFAAGNKINTQGAAQSNQQTGGLTGFFAQFGLGAVTGILLALAGIVGLVIVAKETP